MKELIAIIVAAAFFFGLLFLDPPWIYAEIGYWATLKTKPNS